MSETRDAPAPACGKITYDSRKFAQAAMRATLRRSNAKRKGGTASAYYCAACADWHWGRRT